jgi:predicted DNA binding CopG/RHH family protein
MAKRPSPEEIVGGFIGEAHTEHTQEPDKAHTEHTQTPDDELKRREFRISDRDWQALQRKAAAEGTKPSTIIRRLVKEYIRR